VRDGGAVLRVEVGVDLVKEVEGRRVALLDGEDERERAQAWSEELAEARKAKELGNALFCPPLSCWIRCCSSCLLLKLTLIPTPV
jgi:hypothetical protein